MLGLAIDGITSLSIKPIESLLRLRIDVKFFSFLIIWVLWAKFSNNLVAGWASINVSLLGGVQLISLVLSGNIGKIYLEAKERPDILLGNGRKMKHE